MISVGEEESLEHMVGHAKYVRFAETKAQPHAIAMATVLHY